jgi:8-oxo-dGTP pyrophosphatase MutT (NUDIX family)
MIKKCAAIILKNNRLLVVENIKTSTYISPGGKCEYHESHIKCLSREIKEALDVEIYNPVHFSGDYSSSVFGDKPIEINSWLVNITSKLVPCLEICDLKWVTSIESKKIRIGNIFKEKIIPKLTFMGLIK